MTPELAEEIRALLARGPAAAGYRVPRVTWHLGRWIRTTDWYPDYQLRLYDRRRANWPARRVHESVKADGAVVDLKHDLQHYAYKDIGHHMRTMDRYTTLAAEQMAAEGRRAGFARARLSSAGRVPAQLPAPPRLPRRHPGLHHLAMNSYYVFLKFAKLWTKSGARYVRYVGYAGTKTWQPRRPVNVYLRTLRT